MIFGEGYPMALTSIAHSRTTLPPRCLPSCRLRFIYHRAPAATNPTVRASFPAFLACSVRGSLLDRCVDPAESVLHRDHGGGG